MTRFAIEFFEGIGEEFLAEASTDGLKKAHQKLTHKATRFQRRLKIAKNRQWERMLLLKDFMQTPIPLLSAQSPQLKKLRASWPVQMAFEALDNPISRCVMIVGLVCAASLAVEAPIAAALLSVVASYIIKTGSGCLFHAIKHALDGKKHAHASRDKKSGGYLRGAIRQIGEVGFGVGKHNPVENILDIIMTATGAIVFLPTALNISYWVGGLLSARAERLVTEQIAQRAIVKGGEQAAMQQASANAEAHGLRGIILERFSGAAKQGTAKFLGTKLAEDGSVVAVETVESSSGKMLRLVGQQAIKASETLPFSRPSYFAGHGAKAAAILAVAASTMAAAANTRNLGNDFYVGGMKPTSMPTSHPDQALIITENPMARVNDDAARIAAQIRRQGRGR